MPTGPQQVREAVAKRLPEARQLLTELIAIPSLSGEEADAMTCAAKAFGAVAGVDRVAMTNALREDKDYSDPIPGIEYEGRYNLRVVLGGAGAGRNLLLNTHIDTVPASQGQENAYSPILRDEKIFGRGACDAKGQIATMYLAMASLGDLGAPLRGDVIGHVVVEEENGGNGTLAMVRNGETADGCVVLEPTDLRILTSIRGAVWFRLRLRGDTGHSGVAGRARNSVKTAIGAIETLEGYHARLLAESRGDPLFDRYPNPMPLTIGEFHAGNWPASAPGEAVVAGVLGFLPNKTAPEVMAEIADALGVAAGPDAERHADVRFTYRHDASVAPTDHPLVTSLEEAVRSCEREPQVDAMTASCDAWFYNNQLGIPTVVFGGGSLGVAHSTREHMSLSDLAAAAEILVRLALEWCA